MGVQKVNQVQNVGIEANDDLKLQSYTNTPNSADKTGYALHEVFNQDVMDTSPVPEISKSIQSERMDPTVQKKVTPWWNVPSTKDASLTAGVSEVQGDSEKKAQPISYVPALEIPESMESLANENLELAKQSPVTKRQKSQEQLSSSQLAEGLARMSEKTIEQIMYIIIKAQMELEKENAHVAEGTFSKYQNLKQLRENVLQEIKDALARDEQVAGYFQTGQKLAMAASFVCGMAAGALLFPGLVPAIGAAGVIGAKAAALTTVLAKYGPAVTASFTALTTGSKAYYQKRINEDKASHELLNHQDKYYNDRIDDARQRLIAVAETDSVFKERLIQLMKRYNKMVQLVLQK